MAMSNCAGSRARFSSSSRSCGVMCTRSAPVSVRALAYSSRLQLCGSWETSASTSATLMEAQAVASTSSAAVPKRQTVRLGNKNTNGPFAPLVVVVRQAVGEKEFNKIRGKAISVHSQVIKDFCGQVGVNMKQAQGVVRLAKKNGEWLGFLA